MYTNFCKNLEALNTSVSRFDTSQKQHTVTVNVCYSFNNSMNKLQYVFYSLQPLMLRS